MSEAFRTDAEVAVPRLAHIAGCSCPLHQRRLFGAALLAGGASAALPALAQQPQEGVKGEVGKTSPFARLVPAEQVEQAAAAQYAQMTREAAGERALMPASHPQVVRLRAIAERLVPHTYPWNPRARGWRWEVNLIGSEALNAFCMPGGKIAFFYGILQRLQLTDAEVAAIMGHEMAHALREHARERMDKTFATRAGASLVSSLLGLGSLGDTALGMGAQMLTLKFSREDESEADVVGLELAARGGYDPAAGLSLWRKMMRASQGAPPEFLSTHPAGDSRLRDIGRVLTKVEPLYARAAKPRREFGPPRG
jgi:predicted Zn-dependent protease